MTTSVERLLNVTEVDLMEVEGLTYRRASVRDPFLMLPRSLLSEFEESLAQLAGWKSRDNHTVYRLTEKYGETKTVYVSFSGRSVSFGLSIEGW